MFKKFGVFGYLFFQEVKDNGVVNVGYFDQVFVLVWVKFYICKFGGDFFKVIIVGQFVGVGFVMYYVLVVNGDFGFFLFDKGFVQFFYLFYQFNFNDVIFISRYYVFFVVVGCFFFGSVFFCLFSKSVVDFEFVLFLVIVLLIQGSWGFWFVIDGVYIKNCFIVQFIVKRVNGNKFFVGYNVYEGFFFVFGFDVIEIQVDFFVWMVFWFFNFFLVQLNSILVINFNLVLSFVFGFRFEIDGFNIGGFNVINISFDGVGQKQRGNNIYVEVIFVCFVYWFVDVYLGNLGKFFWLYQFFVFFVYYGVDINVVFGFSIFSFFSDIIFVFCKVWGNFIVGGNLFIVNMIVNGVFFVFFSVYYFVFNWFVWNQNVFQFVNFNIIGGIFVIVEFLLVGFYFQYEGLGIKNVILVQNVNIWEVYCGDRCVFYKNFGLYMLN